MHSYNVYPRPGLDINDTIESLANRPKAIPPGGMVNKFRSLISKETKKNKRFLIHRFTREKPVIGLLDVYNLYSYLFIFRPYNIINLPNSQNSIINDLTFLLSETNVWMSLQFLRMTYFSL